LTCRWWHTSFDLLNLSLLRQRCAPSRCALRQEKPSPSSSASTSWRRGAAWISAARTLLDRRGVGWGRRVAVLVDHDATCSIQKKTKTNSIISTTDDSHI